jgi:hypothetical protein
MNRIPDWARYLISVVLFAFAMLGAMNAVHESAKAFYGILNAGAGALFVATLIRSRRAA